MLKVPTTCPSLPVLVCLSVSHASTSKPIHGVPSAPRFSYRYSATVNFPKLDLFLFPLGSHSTLSLEQSSLLSHLLHCKFLRGRFLVLCMEPIRSSSLCHCLDIVTVRIYLQIEQSCNFSSKLVHLLMKDSLLDECSMVHNSKLGIRIITD